VLKYLFLLLAALSGFIIPAHAQSYYFRQYQVEKGLSNNSVFCSIQDANGFMWFGTKDGLNRFDGYSFKTYYVRNRDGSSLAKNHISSLALDKKERLWVGCQKGLYRYDDEQEALIPLFDTLPSVHDLFIDSQGQLWFVSGATLHRYNFSTKVLISFPVSSYFAVTAICETPDGSMWFASPDGYIHRFHRQREIFLAYSVFSNSAAPASRQIEKMLPDGKQGIYIGTINQGIKLFNYVTGDYKDVLTYNRDNTAIYVRDILRMSEKETWFATESGIFILDHLTGKFTNLKKNYLDPYSLSDNAVYTLHKDKEGGMWVGTYFGGINYYPKQYYSFQKYFPDYSDNAISGNAVREICEDRFGNLWIGTEDAGLNKLNRKTKRITRFEPTGTASSITHTNIHGLLVAGDSLWVGTFQHGVNILDIKTGKVKKHYAAGAGAHQLKSNFIVSMLQTRGGEIYLGTGSGVFRYNPKNDGFTHCEQAPATAFISNLFEDHAGTIWVGTHDRGIFFFNPITGKKGSFVNDPLNKNSLTSDNINAICEDSFNNLWIATEGGGLCKLDEERKIFKSYTTNNGLPGNFVFKVLEDNNKRLWITTSKGMVNMDPVSGKMTVYTKSNGLLNDQFNYNSGYKDAEGRLYFGSVRGMIAFNPGLFFKSTFVPPVFITGFQVNNKEVGVNKEEGALNRSIVYSKEITLGYEESSFSVDFAALSFTSPEMNEYSYKMEGLERDWTYIKSNRKVYFTNLEPGHYTFKVRGGSNGVWNTEVRSLNIIITPPFWATRWAYLVYIVLSACLLYYVVSSYHKMQENKKQKEIYQSNIEFFTSIAHEIKTPLTLIKGPVENLSEMVSDIPVIRDDVVTMERNTNRLINLVNQILDFRQTETKGFSLDFSTVNVNAILEEAYLTFEPFAKKRRLSYQVQLPSEEVSILADGEALNKIFSNLFSNATKYAKSKVKIELLPLHDNDAFLFIEISNDGFVIPNNMKEKIFEPFFRLKETLKQKGTGIGLALARSLVALHQGSLFLKEKDDDMNVFVVKLPYNNNLQKRKTKAAEATSLMKMK
jgi:ligand-binding sensor domain-containing protein/nitrogen-specific signal transduction histidine kinase